MKNAGRTDTIVDEVYAIRAEIAAECGFDVRRIAEHAAQEAKNISGLNYISLEEMKRRRHTHPAPNAPDQK
jgi:sensor histidine kinase regulating citrate/malate metabolism